MPILLRGAMSNFIFQDQSSNHHYRTELPNIIYEIGLDANEIALYSAIKRSAGDSGACTRSNTKLAKMAGMSSRTLQRILPRLLIINKILKKPLIIRSERINEDGDQDTNLITIIDIWPDNYSFFKKQNRDDKLSPPHDKLTRGQVKMTPPRVTDCHDPGDNLSYKEEPFKKNINKKTTTTNKSKLSSSFSGEISQEVKDSARQVFDLIQLRQKKEPEERWNLDLATLEKHFHIHGISYAIDQFNYLISRMNKYRSNKNKMGNKTEKVDDPSIYFQKACSENWSKSLHKNQEKTS